MSPLHSDGEGGRRRVLSWVALTSALTGLGLLGLFYVIQQQPPDSRSSGTTTQPPISDGVRPSGDTESKSPSEPNKQTRHRSDDVTGRAQVRSLPTSRPVSIRIAAIGVQSDVIRIGKKPDGRLAVPKGDDIDKAAWFTNSPTPGQLGPSVIEGHIDTDEGPSVFYRLADLKSGDTVRVTRADGKVAVFTVTGVRDYPTNDDFPTELVYGGDLTSPTLRLITCSNFNPDTGHYAGNTVVYSTLTNVAT